MYKLTKENGLGKTTVMICIEDNASMEDKLEAFKYFLIMTGNVLGPNEHVVIYDYEEVKPLRGTWPDGAHTNDD